MATLPLFDRVPTEGEDVRDKPRVFRVAEVNRSVRLDLEGRWGDVWIEGELGEVSGAASGHVYFTLCDEKEPAQIRGVMFRADARRARAKLKSGVRVRFRGTLSLYEPRGSYQLIARLAIPAGDGDLAAQFERVRRKLEAEGLFAGDRKRALPRLPRVVGVVTSAHGAALHDIIRVARHRCPVRIVVSDCRVQGEGAGRTIAAALASIQRLEELDVVIVARGGGSAEELSAFNDEGVARAVAECRVPVVSGVGHEVDVTICDLVADARAATPSNAAELAVPDRDALARDLDACTRRLERAIDGELRRKRLDVERVARKVSDPRHALGSMRRKLDVLTHALQRLARVRVARARARTGDLRARIARHDPRAQLARDRRALESLGGRIGSTARQGLASHRRALGELLARLDAMSPVKVLARGYSIAIASETGKALLSADEIGVGERIRVRLSRGELTARVEEKREAAENESED